VCSSLTPVGDEEITCPDAGTYTFTNAFASPGGNWWDIPSWLQGYSFTVTLSITDSAGAAVDTTCTTKASTAGTSSDSGYGNDGSNSSGSFTHGGGYQIVMGVTAAAALVTGLWMRRRRIRTQQQDARMSLLEMEYNPSRNQNNNNASVAV